VVERGSADEEDGGHQDEGEREPLLVAVQARRDEQPELPMMSGAPISNPASNAILILRKNASVGSV